MCCVQNYVYCTLNKPCECHYTFIAMLAAYMQGSFRVGALDLVPPPPLGNLNLSCAEGIGVQVTMQLTQLIL
jgi:hypothetical protein